MTPGLPPDFLRGEERLALARLMISDGDLVRALDVLDTHLEAAEAGRRTTRMIQILILKAVAHQANGDSEASETVIERALELAEPEGFLRVFVDEGEPMIRLLRRVVRKSRSREFASLILAAAEPGERGASIEQPLIDPLSGRELEILRHLQTNLTSNEIAQELFIATSTVRSHMKSIYSKLDAHSRREAIQIATDLGLIPDR
jgi:LuxR family maltose regulon positive regulatory protein